MYIFGMSSTATLIDLSVQGNEAGDGPDIYNNYGSFTCANSCSAGQYSNCSGETAQTNQDFYQCYVNCGSCRSCQAGTSNPNTGSMSDAACEPCAPGFVSPRAGAASCTSCEAGHYATNDGEQYGVIAMATNCSEVCGGPHSPMPITIHITPNTFPPYRSAQPDSTSQLPLLSFVFRVMQERAPTEPLGQQHVRAAQQGPPRRLDQLPVCRVQLENISPQTIPTRAWHAPLASFRTS